LKSLVVPQLAKLMPHVAKEFRISQDKRSTPHASMS